MKTQAAYISDARALIDAAHLCCTPRASAKGLYAQAVRIFDAIPQAGVPYDEVRSISNLRGEAEVHVDALEVN